VDIIDVIHAHKLADRAIDTRIENPPTPPARIWRRDYERYKKWIEDSPGCLWLTGCPGAGKTAIVNFILSEMGRDKIPADFSFFGKADNKLPNLNRDGNHRSLEDLSTLQPASYHFRKTLRSRRLRTSLRHYVVAFRTGDTFIVCDAGGGTLDVTTYNFPHLDKQPVRTSREECESPDDVLIAVM